MLQIGKDYNVMHFNNDEEFYNFCVNPAIVISTNSLGIPYQTFNFSKEYTDAVNNGTCFIINDENSQIYKRGAVSYKTITKKVDNLIPYYDDYNF